MNWEEYSKEKRGKHSIMPQLFDRDLRPIPPYLSSASQNATRAAQKWHFVPRCAVLLPQTAVLLHESSACWHPQGTHAAVGCTGATCTATMQPMLPALCFETCAVQNTASIALVSIAASAVLTSSSTATSSLPCTDSWGKRRSLARRWQPEHPASIQNQTFRCFVSKWHFCLLV